MLKEKEWKYQKTKILEDKIKNVKKSKDNNNFALLQKKGLNKEKEKQLEEKLTILRDKENNFEKEKKKIKESNEEFKKISNENEKLKQRNNDLIY